MLKSGFQQRFKMLRDESGYNQTEFAENFKLRTGVNMTVSAVSNYERGQRVPEIGLLQTMADYFGVTLDFLMGRTDNRKETSAASLVPDGFEFKSMDDILKILYLKLVSDGKLKAGDPLPEVAVRILMDKLAAGSEIVESFKTTGGKSTK